jgi:hypothetical protein
VNWQRNRRGNQRKGLRFCTKKKHNGESFTFYQKHHVSFWRRKLFANSTIVWHEFGRGSNVSSWPNACQKTNLVKRSRIAPGCMISLQSISTGSFTTTFDRTHGSSLWRRRSDWSFPPAKTPMLERKVRRRQESVKINRRKQYKKIRG